MQEFRFSANCCKNYHRSHLPKMVSDLIIRNRAVSNVCAIPMYWSTIVSMALSWVQKFYSFYNFYVFIWISEMMKTRFPQLCNPKDSDIIRAIGAYPSTGGMIDETSSDFVNKRCTAFVHTWDLSRMFNTLDSDGDGIVTAEDVQGLLEKLGIQYISDDNMKIVMGSPEHMSFDDFCGFFLNLWEEAREHPETEEKVMLEELVNAFSVFDKNGDGFISPCELQQVLLSLGLKEGRDLESCEMMITRFDRNSDGRIDFEEFENMMTMTDKSL